MKLIKKLLILATSLALSVWMLCSCNNSVYRYDHAELYTAGSFTYEASAVQMVALDWVEGSVTIQKAQGDTCSVTESNPAQSLDEQVHYYLDGATLRVKYCKSGYWIKDINASNKTLLLEIPENTSLVLSSVNSVITVEENSSPSFSADLVAGSLTATNLSSTTLSVSSVSADIHLDMTSTASVWVETVGGNVTLNIHDTVVPAPTLFAKTVGGNLHLTLDAETTSTLETVGGNISLALHAGFGAQLTYSTVGGIFYTERAFTKTDNTYSLAPQSGSPTCVFSVNTVGGNLSVL